MSYPISGLNRQYIAADYDANKLLIVCQLLQVMLLLIVCQLLQVMLLLIVCQLGNVILN